MKEEQILAVYHQGPQAVYSESKHYGIKSHNYKHGSNNSKHARKKLF
ncbi:hypothetical protein [Aeribacillus alveayuensis]|uniref:Uncharacterized protein n=1 Tax=Aeribacillus alveayuensis TaxID=279215 RepID=A0ABT9VNJ6_9BACI|nr:hypothetical protein [Bacillus alveayuensis]